MIQQERRGLDAPQGRWLLRLAIIAASAGLYATVLDEIAASIVLYVTAIGALSLFMHKYVRPFYRKYIKPLQGLTEKLDNIREQQGVIKSQIAAVKERVEQEAKAEAQQLGRIERGAEIAAERAQSAINIAEAVRRQIGATARGDVKDDPDE